MEEKSPFKVPMGAEVSDNLTGFDGIVTGRAEYRVGGPRYLVTARVATENGIVEEWIEEDRLLRPEIKSSR